MKAHDLVLNADSLRVMYFLISVLFMQVATFIRIQWPTNRFSTCLPQLNMCEEIITN